MTDAKRWNELARYFLSDYLRDIQNLHTIKENFENDQTHLVATHVGSCVHCEQFVSILMFLNGMEFKK